MTSGLVNASFSLPEGQAVKMIFFAPCLFICKFYNTKSKNWQASDKEPATEIKSTAVLPYIKGLSEPLGRCLLQHGVQSVFKSDTTPRSHLVRPKDPVDP